MNMGMGGPLGGLLESSKNDNMLTISWVDSAWVPILNANNVMDYFSEPRNPFYDRTCNNEMLKMQRASLDQLPNMMGIEFCLLYVQEPILYVVRKQQRHSPTQVTPISDYYIVAGTIYQAPDLCSVVNSRLLGAVNHLQSAFEEARGYAKYHPSKGYTWDFDSKKDTPHGARRALNQGDEDKKKGKKKKKEDKPEEEAASMFQRRRVDMLLDLLTKRFPFKMPPQQASAAAASNQQAAGQEAPTKAVPGDDLKSEKGAESVKSEKSSTVHPTTSEPDHQQQLQRGIKREATAASMASTSGAGPRPGHSGSSDPSKRMKLS